VLSPNTQYNLANAKSYFEEHLCVGDYYTEGEKVSGEWFGRGAEMLGLANAVGQKEFLSLCDNLNPHTGKLLTQRQKSTRRDTRDNGKEIANRRIFYDFTISPPKSVSILAFLGGDNRILDAHNRAIKIAMKELEGFAQTRVRSQGECSDRPTGNVIGAMFRHDTSRTLDPHLHSHCILFNATFDSVEKRWKALQNHEMLLARKYVENVYYHELTRELLGFGYEIQNHARGDFEIRGVSQKLCEKFSKRHAQIDEKTRELLARDPGLASGNIDDIRASIARNERSRKIKDVPIAHLQRLWSGQLSDVERSELSELIAHARASRVDSSPANARSAVTWAEEHLFDRKSVVHEHEIWRNALEHARGQAISIGELRALTAQADYIRDAKKPWRMTTREVLRREWEIVELAKTGAGRHEALNAAHVLCNRSLDEGQRRAVAHILGSRDFVTLFRGGAGTGKSYALREVNSGLLKGGRPVRVIAPQRQQVMDLVRDGFYCAQTLSEFLARREMEQGAVVIVDEAGQIGAKQMRELLSFIRRNNGRVILSGDTRQHGAVETSDALRAIEAHAGLTAAELTEIRRQNPVNARNETERQFVTQYKLAVEEAADRKMGASFDRLEKAGAIVECRPTEQHERLSAHYLDLARNGQTTVVVAQTWSEIHKVNESVRQALRREDLIGTNERKVVALERVDLTDAQKRDPRFYENESVLVFNRDTGGFRKGQRGRLVAIMDDALVIESDRKIRGIGFSQLDRLTVCRQKELALSTGDRLQLKANAKTKDGRPLANGELVSVAKVESSGCIVLSDGRKLDKDYRQFVRGYAVTSYGSQGKTVDYVLFSDSAAKAATNLQQWYVTISRGRKGIKIFTTDKEQLRENIARSGDRELALDLTRLRHPERRFLRRGLTRVRQLALIAARRFASILARRKSPGTQQQTVVP
jgi:conjugative relaxase-like TrwC/TraI family protein